MAVDIFNGIIYRSAKVSETSRRVLIVLHFKRQYRTLVVGNIFVKTTLWPSTLFNLVVDISESSPSPMINSFALVDFIFSMYN
jgi:hypothetical protein